MVCAMRSFENINEETLKNGYRVMRVKWASSTTGRHCQCCSEKEGRRRGWRMSEIRTAMRRSINMKMAVFWGAAPCSLVEVYRRFRGTCCLHGVIPCQINTGHIPTPSELNDLLRHSSPNGDKYSCQILLLHGH
jgi:hypothetical protein